MSTCANRYNSLLNNAKTALIAGDRTASVDFLEQAQRLIPICPALQDGASPALLTVLQSFKTACDVDCIPPSES